MCKMCLIKHLALEFRITGRYYSEGLSIHNMFDSITRNFQLQWNKWDGIISVSGVIIEIADSLTRMKKLNHKILQAKWALWYSNIDLNFRKDETVEGLLNRCKK